MGVLAGLLQSLPERQEDVAWIDEREGVGDGRAEEEKKTPILLSVSTALKRPRLDLHGIFILIEMYELVHLCTCKVKLFAQFWIKIEVITSFYFVTLSPSVKSSQKIKRLKIH